ncbi:MAG TPA: DUF5946 family protein [Gemmatimonadales bacterium]|nr:DUF5946 family protein [Gemmatimonadales bacterium]
MRELPGTTADRSELEAYDELRAYTLSHRDPAFLHQHVVDAWTAQHADDRTKPIALAFALVGLCLHLERGFTGRQVQRVHMEMARRRKDWPAFPLPSERGGITARDVVREPPGPARDRAIDLWCAAVWEAFRESRPKVIRLLAEHGLA